jgi:hypothetical protein
VNSAVLAAIRCHLISLPFRTLLNDDGVRSSPDRFRSEDAINEFTLLLFINCDENISYQR